MRFEPFQEEVAPGVRADSKQTGVASPFAKIDQRSGLEAPQGGGSTKAILQTEGATDHDQQAQVGLQGGVSTSAVLPAANDCSVPPLRGSACGLFTTI